MLIDDENLIPSYETDGAAGADLKANITEPIVLKPFARVIVPTGIKVAIPRGFNAELRSRSGLAFKNGVIVINAPGTIDADFRGEVGIILINLGDEDFIINRYDRIAQMVIAPVLQVVFKRCTSLDETSRGSGGFGSTGI
jgi:dUTP pyrophosphatase